MTDATLHVRRSQTPRGAGACASRTREASSFAVRCTEKERAAIKPKARPRPGSSVGAFLRALALGDAGPRAVRTPPVERKELARLLGHLGKVGSNVNQLAHAL